MNKVKNNTSSLHYPGPTHTYHIHNSQGRFCTQMTDSLKTWSKGKWYGFVYIDKIQRNKNRILI